MSKTLKVAVIGAGTISKSHLHGYKALPNVTLAAVCDLNEERAWELAKEFGAEKACADYHEVLNDPTIEAVSIVTPTFTHGKIVCEALAAGKHVLCEKPPALTYEEALQNEETAKKSGKVLMYGFVVRFMPNSRFIKEYIDAGRLGEIYYAETSRMANSADIGGWFRDKTKSGGGMLMDAAIHQLDLLLWFMGYPKVKSVKGFTSDVNKDLPERLRGYASGYASADNKPIPRTIESFATGYITFEDEKNLVIKAAHIANTPNPGTRFELLGDKGGVSCEGDKLKFLTIDESNYFANFEPVIYEKSKHFEDEIRHFVDCCHGDAQCISNASQGTQIIRILNAIYESAETGREILF